MSDNGASTPEAGSDRLWKTFVDPPDEARPRVWWHWMDGNVDPAGIVRDLHWLHDVGVRGVQMFDGGMGGPLVVPSAVRPGTAAWDDAIQTAVRTASELGMELAVATSPGWSASGGPWVEPVDAMKKVVWSETVVTGGSELEAPLAPLPAVTGPYQDCPRWGATGAGPSYSTNWIVLAVPAEPSHDVLVPAGVTGSSPVDDRTCLTDGAFDRSLVLPRDPDGWSTAWVEQRFDQPVTVRSVVVGLPGPHGFGAAPPADAVLQASDDGVSYRNVADLPASAIPVRTSSFPAVTALRFRLVLSAGSAADALPPLSDGVRRPPVLRPATGFTISEFALRPSGRVDHAEAKAGYGVVRDYFAVPTNPRVALGSIDPATVLDVSAHVRDGMLRWKAPAGRWRILRLGASLTGQTNGPALADVTGLEVDKLDGRRVRAYLDTHLAQYGDAATSGVQHRVRALLSDSIEAGPQNWTEGILDSFERLRGYDPRPWLPALAGYLVGSPDRSDRFLYDYRRTLSELLAAEYYGTLAAEAARRGLVYYAEALEDGRPQLGDDLAMRARADVPMGAMWTFDPASGPRPTYVADLKGAASVAHVYGKDWVGAEAFSSFDRPWAATPRTLKHVADLQLALGVTRFCIHTSPHQPIAALPPGIALAPFLGQAFTINETWAGMAGPWIDYLARCSAILSAGRPAVDIAVFVGEEGPVTALFESDLDASVPCGYDFDYVGADALATVLSVENGAVTSAGATYRLLYLGGSSSRLTVDALLALERLVDDGATLVGARPTASPSLADDPRTFDAACERIWSGTRQHGRVVDTGDLSAALLHLGMRPMFEVEGPPVRQIARVIDGRQVTFVANPSADTLEVRILVASGSEPLVAWDPVRLRRSALVPDPHPRDDGRRGYRLVLPPFGSVFVLASAAPLPEPAPQHSYPIDGTWEVALPGRAPRVTSPRPRLWTDLGGEERAFSGVGVYRAEASLTAQQLDADRILLDLGTVRDIARVIVNGVDCGVAWTAPFRVDVTAAVRPGVNSVEAQVANPWRNRLIAEAAEPSGSIHAPMTAVFEASAEPLPAGLAGPVRLMTETASPLASA